MRLLDKWIRAIREFIRKIKGDINGEMDKSSFSTLCRMVAAVMIVVFAVAFITFVRNF